MGITALPRTTDIDVNESLAQPADRKVVAGNAACRGVDLIIAPIALLFLLPLMIVIAIAIKLDSAGPVLFRQRRLGRGMKPFTVQKFRTMKQGVSQDIHRQFVIELIAGTEPDRVEGKPQFKLSADPRVTRLGRFLRRSSLDELPQLWNVIRGDMSLVGPRPALEYEVEHYPKAWLRRFVHKPGMTGLWQVSGRSELTMAEMVKLDIEYTDRRSVWLNLSILLRTIPVVLFARGAS
jgi:lipopolysaccharide/colanic/teichoic acid biosynthesis glycosyltransferase